MITAILVGTCGAILAFLAGDDFARGHRARGWTAFAFGALFIGCAIGVPR